MPYKKYVLSYVTVRFISLYLIGDFIRTRGMHFAVLYRSANISIWLNFTIRRNNRSTPYAKGQKLLPLHL